MTPFVVDASVVAKWYLPEAEADQAVRLLDVEHSLHVPDLVFPEVGNILWKKVNRNELTAQDAEAIVVQLLSVPMTVHACGPLLGSAVRLALTTGRTAYDALYLALAIELGCVLVTADERFCNALRSTSLGNQVKHVREFDPTANLGKPQ